MRPNGEPADVRDPGDASLGFVKNCITNQMPSTTAAGSSNRPRKNKIGTRLRTRACGHQTMYAPMTPAIAPDAPIIGTVELALNAT